VPRAFELVNHQRNIPSLRGQSREIDHDRMGSFLARFLKIFDPDSKLESTS
jgi:hypothetical protein